MIDFILSITPKVTHDVILFWLLLLEIFGLIHIIDFEKIFYKF